LVLVLKMALIDQLVLVGLAIVRLVFAIIFAVLALYIASNVLGRLTKQFKEWEEIKKGNVAVAIYMAGIFISIATIIGPGVTGLFIRLDILAIIWGFVQLVIALALAVAAQYAGLSVLGKLTKGIDEWSELQKGNVAVGLIMASVVIAIAAVVSQGVASLLTALLA
jgi:uncharacterized membrane protein YjfL (UPF0719 family)